MHKGLYFLSFLLFMALLFSCKRQAKHDDKFVFRYNESSGINSLDPAFSRELGINWATNQLYNGLLQMDNSLVVQPSIARRFTIDSSNTHYTFYLRNDVFFHANTCFGEDSTRLVEAQDFVYSLERLQEPALASPGKWTLNAVDKIWAESDSILHIKLKYPFPPFAGVLTMKYCSVVPKEAVEHFGQAFSQNPVGTGPFKFRAWFSNEKLVLRKNPAYFEKDENGIQLPYADGIAIRFITDEQAAFLEFLKGNLDLISGLDASYKDEIITQDGHLRAQYAEKYSLLKQPYLNTEYLIFTVDTSQNNQVDKRLRKAINLGIDRKSMMAYLRNNIGKPADGGIVPFGLPGNISGKGYEYNVEAAKGLIEEVKQEKGSLPIITLTTVGNYRDLCEFIQSELGKIGLPIEVDVIPAATLREKKSNAAMQFFRASWIADYPDAENYLSLFFGPNRSPNGPNYSRFFNASFNKLYLEAIASPDAQKRELLYQKMDSLIIDESPIVPLYYDESVRIFPKHLEGLEGNGMNLLDLRFVKKVKEEVPNAD